MQDRQQAYIQIHIAVLLFGLTAVLGELIILPAILLVWWRVLITPISLWSFRRTRVHVYRINKRQKLIFIGIGVIIAIHWLCFYGSIKLANASVSLICMSTTSLMTSFLEPLITKSKIQKFEIALSLLVVPGIYFIAQNSNMDFQFGFVLGLFSAFFAALFSVLNKRNIHHTDPYAMTFIELSGSWFFLTLVIGVMMIFTNYSFTPFFPAGMVQWFYIIVLSLLCTTIAYILSLKALKHLSAFTTNLVINLEPVYGIVLAILLLNQHKEMHYTFYIGAGFIIFTILLHSLISKNKTAAI